MTLYRKKYQNRRTRHIYLYVGNTFFPMLLAPLSTTLPAPPPSAPAKKKQHFLQIWILCQNSLTREHKIRVVGLEHKIRIVGFVLKKLLTFF